MTQLPHSEEAEAALVSRLFVDPGQIPVVAGQLDHLDIYDPTYRQLYRSMVKLSGEGTVIDRVTLTDEAGLTYLPKDLLTGATAAHRAPVDEYVEIIKRDAFRRRVIASMERVEQAASEHEDRQEILAAMQGAMEWVLKGVDDDRLIRPDQAMRLYEETLEKRRLGKRAVRRYGIAQLDELIQPAQGGDMIVVAARPSVGKTALAQHIADRWAENGEPVLYVSLEMKLAQLADRYVTRTTQLPSRAVQLGSLDDLQMILVREAIEARKGLPVWYLDDPYATSATVRAAVAKTRMLAGAVGGIVVDYLQLLKDKHENDVSRVTRISQALKALALEFDVPVLALSQLNRASTGREDPHPRLQDLRDSGAIEQDADVVIGLHRKLGTPDLDLEILKNRMGPVGQLELYFDVERVGIA